MSAADADADTPALPEPDWVFGYGSLIWNPGFAYQEAVLARVHGYRRSFCIRSARYRGTPEAPGVVLGLAQGGSCIGMAFRLDPAHRAAAVRSLYEREMPGQLYVPRMIEAFPLTASASVRALTFVANTAHPAFGVLPETEVLRRLLNCAGERGPNLEYALRTHQSLRAHGVRCTVLERLIRGLGQTKAADAVDSCEASDTPAASGSCAPRPSDNQRTRASDDVSPSLQGVPR